MYNPGPDISARQQAKPAADGRQAQQWPPEVIAAVAERVMQLLQNEHLLWEERTGQSKVPNRRRRF